MCLGSIATGGSTRTNIYCTGKCEGFAVSGNMRTARAGFSGGIKTLRRRCTDKTMEIYKVSYIRDEVV